VSGELASDLFCTVGHYHPENSEVATAISPSEKNPRHYYSEEEECQDICLTVGKLLPRLPFNSAAMLFVVMMIDDVVKNLLGWRFSVGYASYLM